MKKTIFIVATVLFSCLFYSFNQLKVDNEIYDPTGIVAPNAKLEKLGEGYSFTEGPAVDKQGNVFFTDQPNDKIIQWSAKTGALTTFSANSGGRANGMYFDSDKLKCTTNAPAGTNLAIGAAPSNNEGVVCGGSLNGSYVINNREEERERQNGVSPFSYMMEYGSIQ